MKTSLWIALVVLAVPAGVVGLNHAGYPVPGLEWARIAALETAAAPPVAGAEQPASGRRANGSGGGGRRGGMDGPVPVVVAESRLADVPVYLRGVGTARALNTVTIRPQVDGKLIKVHFREGQDVKRGDLLAEIDPATYQATLDQAKAKLKLTQSLLANAELDYERSARVGPNVTPQKTIDTQKSLVQQYQAQVKSDEAAIASATAVLGYTRILAPIDGRTGQRLVDEGNLVRAGDAGIVTIAQVQPVSVMFTLPQQQLKDVNAALAVGPVLVEAMDSDDKTVIDAGNLTFIDNQIDQTTGTVKMKADLPNARLQLWPGQFSNVRVLVNTLRQSVTTPTAAIQRGPQGTFVYVLKAGEGEKPKSTVGVRVVTVAQQDDRTAVITKGLGPAEKVVTSGFARLRDAAEVTVTRTEGTAGDGGGEAAPAPARTSAAPATGAPEATAPDAKAASEVKGKSGRPDRVGRAEGSGEKGREGKRNRASNESAVQ